MYGAYTLRTWIRHICKENRPVDDERKVFSRQIKSQEFKALQSVGIQVPDESIFVFKRLVLGVIYISGMTGCPPMEAETCRKKKP